MSNERLQRIKDAAMTDNGLAIQMARYSHEDVLWLIAKAEEAERLADDIRDSIQTIRPNSTREWVAQYLAPVLAAGRPTT